MRQFDLKEYLKNPSRKVVTRDGKNVKIHCTNYIGGQHTIAQVEGNDYSTSFYEDGRYAIDRTDSHLDLFFAPEEHKKWINIYRDTTGVSSGATLYDSREDAEKVGKTDGYYVATSKVEWEE